MHERIFGIIMAVAVLVALFELLRRQSIKEKYLVLWLATAVVIVAVAVHPPLVNYVARLTGIKSGPNVVFVLGGLLITLVSVHVSIEISRLEDRSRALAEEVGLLRLELQKVRAGVEDE